MRIAILTSSYPRFLGDGTAPFIASIAEGMVKAGHSVEVVAPYDSNVDDLSINGIKSHRFKYTLWKKMHIMGHGRALVADVRLSALAIILLPLYLLFATAMLWKVTGRQKSDVIHVHWVLPNGPAAAIVAIFRRIPLIISLHGSDVFLASKYRLFGVVAQWVFHHAAGVTACSVELRDQAIKLGAPKTIELIAWGADPNIFKPAEDKQALRAKLGWGDGIVITALGRMVYKKGFNVLLNALPSVIEKHHDVKVVIGGDGPILPELKHLSESLGISEAVRFVGTVPWNEVPEFLAASDIYILPSVRDKSGNLDGLPTVLLEAMGCGLAIIASDIGGVSLAIQNQINGLLVNPGSVEDLIQSLYTLLGNHELVKKIGNAARQTIVENLNWDNVVREIERIIMSSISNKGFQHRMGSVYRYEMLQNTGLIAPKDDKVLDIGCYDGLLLSKTNANLRVGVDLVPIPGLSNISFVIADAKSLPFKCKSFDKIYALDIIEHIDDDRSFSHSVTNLVADDGKMILTTPSDQIRLYPPFLTRWISKKWGHIFRLGYSAERLIELFGDSLNIQIQTWNAPGYRFLYLALRVLQRLFPRYVERFVRIVCRWDNRRQAGNHGFVIMLATKISDSSLSRTK